MTDNKFGFTDEKLRKLIPAANKRVLFYDLKQPGLAIMVTPAGARSFKFRSWDSLRSKSGTVSIGNYPKVSINTAREMASQYARDLAAGIDIWSQSQADREEPTLDEAFNRWIIKKASKGRTSWKIDRLRYEKHIKPRFGNKRVSDITTTHIENWFLALPEKVGLSTTSANRLLVIIKTVYNQELGKYSNPCKGISLNRENSRERFLRPGELPAFFDALNSDETPEYLRDFIFLALYSGARKANLLGMRWQDIDLDLGVWVIPATDSKNRSAMSIPLIPAAVEILQRKWRENQSIQMSSIFVFPAINARGKSGHMTDVRFSWDALLTRAGISDFNIHDLRRTLGSWQTITGASSAIVGKSLGHKSQQATAIYSRLHLDPVRQSIEKAVAAMEAARTQPPKVQKLISGSRRPKP